MEPDDQIERAAELENEIISHAQELIQEHGYTVDDIAAAIESAL